MLCLIHFAWTEGRPLLKAPGSWAFIHLHSQNTLCLLSRVLSPKQMVLPAFFFYRGTLIFSSRPTLSTLGSLVFIPHQLMCDMKLLTGNILPAENIPHCTSVTCCNIHSSSRGGWNMTFSYKSQDIMLVCTLPLDEHANHSQPFTILEDVIALLQAQGMLGSASSSADPSK